jgi:two-component system nitrogen regulation response regulator GlnG
MVATANRAIESGASLYLTKPVSCDSIIQTIERLLKESQANITNPNDEEQMLFDLVGRSPAMEKIVKLIIKVAPSSATVLLGGENGTGKEYFAQVIHKISKVKGSFIPLNCGAIPEQLFESELFGHAKGSFTGATKDKKGIVEEADGGTLFLDEVGELPLSSQVKLLRFLQERKFKRVGETRERTVNTRIITATNRDLKEMVKNGEFREDLFYRLHVFPITLPPLRDRKESIPNLIALFIHQANKRLNSNFTGFTTMAEFLLSKYAYPGNIRELENIIEHSTIMATPPLITENDLPEYIYGENKLIEDKSSSNSLHLITDGHQQERSDLFCSDGDKSLEEVENLYIRYILEKNENNHSKASKALKISRSTLWRKLKDNSIDSSILEIE